MTSRAPAPRPAVCALLLLPLILGASPKVDATAPDAQAILTRAFDNLYGFSSVQQVEIRSRRADGREFVRRAQIVRRGNRDSLNRMLVRLLGPDELRGLSLLLSERADFSYDAFMYQPALKRVRRISVAQRQDSFFGTDLVFEDLEARRPAQWRGRMLRTENVGDRAAWVIEATPEDVPSGYDRMVGWFDAEIPVMLRADYYRGGERIKELRIEASDVEPHGAYHVPRRMVLTGGNGTHTIVEVPEIELVPELPDELFTRSALEFRDERWDQRRLDGSTP